VSHSSLLDESRVFLPKFLSAAEHDQLLKELGQFPTAAAYYLPHEMKEPEVLQADGWRGFVVADLGTGERKDVSGVVLSNSCDIDLSNRRTLIPRVIFAPLISVANYRARLSGAGMVDNKIERHISAIRQQAVTNIFHLPSMSYGPEESIILFDDIHVQPVNMFLHGNRSRIFRLSQVAFYAFLLKISIHFTRMQEGVRRFPDAVAS
jgi:hypothetical protein